jgi:uncharacterized coiled-coil protein SlyX
MSLEERVSYLEQKVEQLEDLVRNLSAVVDADRESLRITDAEVGRQGQQISSRKRWPQP